jgi:hypothetical protein
MQLQFKYYKPGDSNIITKYVELFTKFNNTVDNPGERNKCIRHIFTHTLFNLQYVLRRNEFKLIIIKKILEFYFSENLLEKKIGKKYLFLLQILHPKHICPK